MSEEIYSVNQLMKKFDCSRSLVNTWFKRGLVKTKIGKLTRVKESDLIAFIEGGKA